MGRRGFKATHKARVSCRYAELDDRCKAQRTGRDEGWQVSTGGGRLLPWSRDGRDCFFKTADQNVMAVSDTAKGDSFEAGKLRVWTETRLREIAGFGNYDLAPDGKRLRRWSPTMKWAGRSYRTT
jgi:hypothetical protein